MLAGLPRTEADISLLITKINSSTPDEPDDLLSLIIPSPDHKISGDGKMEQTASDEAASLFAIMKDPHENRQKSTDSALRLFRIAAQCGDHAYLTQAVEYLDTNFRPQRAEEQAWYLQSVIAGYLNCAEAARRNDTNLEQAQPGTDEGLKASAFSFMKESLKRAIDYYSQRLKLETSQ